MGYVEVPGASSRYTVLHKEGAGSVAWFWVGRNGGARFNALKRVDGALAIGPRVRAKLTQPL